MKNFKLPQILAIVLFMALNYSCSNEELLEENDALEEVLETKDSSELLAKGSEGRGTLDDRCSVRNEVNRTLNNRTYKRYEIVPGTSTDPNNSVRIERFYKLINKKKNRKGTFQATYNISRVDNSHTYIAQSHSATPGGAFGPIYLIRAEPSGNQIKLYRENVLFNRGTQSNGGRDKDFLGTVNKNQDFTLKIITGYNSSNKAFNRVYINGSDKGAKTHSRTDTTMRFRYGAYRAEASTATVYIRNVSYSVNN